MRDIYRLAGEEAQAPQLFIAPLLDRGIGTLKGQGACEPGVRQALYNYIKPELTDSEEIRFADISEAQTLAMDMLIDRYEDITGGLHPGRPTIKSRDVDTGEKLEDFMGLPADEVTAASLEKFYRLTKLRPHIADTAVKSSLEEPSTDERSWGGRCRQAVCARKIAKQGSYDEIVLARARPLLYAVGWVYERRRNEN